MTHTSQTLRGGIFVCVAVTQVICDVLGITSTIFPHTKAVGGINYELNRMLF